MLPRQERHLDREGGVSPIIAVVMILAMSIAGMTAVVTWGLPLIRDSTANTDFNVAVGEFHRLGGALASFAYGNVADATYRWQAPMRHGSLDLNGTSDPWLIAADVVPWVSVNWSGADDGDNAITITTAQTIYSPELNFTIWAGAAYVLLNVSTSSGAGGTCPVFSAGQLDAGTTTFYAFVSGSACVPASLPTTFASLRISGKQAAGAPTEKVHQAYLFKTGRLHWATSSDTGPRMAYLGAGGVYAGKSSLAMDGTPSMPPPTVYNASGTLQASLALRVVQMAGTASWSLDHPAPLTLACQVGDIEDPGMLDNITAVSLYTWGTLRNATYGAMKDPGRGYAYNETGPSGNTFLRYVDGTKPFHFSLVVGQLVCGPAGAASAPGGGPGKAGKACFSTPNQASSQNPPIVTATIHTASYLAFDPSGPCSVTFVTYAATCRGSTVGSDITSPGAYCTSAVQPGHSLLCKWTPVTNSVQTAVFAGWDSNGDGRIRASDGEVLYGPMQAGIVYDFFQASPTPRRLIAYPTNVAGSTLPPGDTSNVGCGEAL